MTWCDTAWKQLTQYCLSPPQRCILDAQATTGAVIKSSLLPAVKQMTHALEHLHLIANCYFYASLRTGFSYRSPPVPLHQKLMLGCWELMHSASETAQQWVWEACAYCRVCQAVPTGLGTYSPLLKHLNGRYKTKSFMAIHRYWELY